MHGLQACIWPLFVTTNATHSSLSWVALLLHFAVLQNHWLTFSMASVPRFLSSLMMWLSCTSFSSSGFLLTWHYLTLLCFADIDLSSMSWCDLPSPSLPTSHHLQPHPPPLCSFHLHSASSASTPLQLWSILAQLMQLHRTHSWTNCESIPDPFSPGPYTKGHHLYTLSTFVLFAWSFFIDNNG